MRAVLCDAVVHRGAVWRGVLGALLLALPELPEGSPEFLGHEVVDDGVDGAVQVDARPAEEQEPDVQVRWVHEGVYHHQCAVRHPQEGEEHHHHCQHFGHLVRGDRQKEKQTDGAEAPAEPSHL